MIQHFEDTIIAPVSAPGVAAISVIRVSGRQSLPLTEKLFFTKSGKPFFFQSKPSHSLHFGTIRLEDKIIDEVLISIFKSPNSFTGEDVVEISCHGSTYIVQEVIKAYLANGARMAGNGEFSMRAFLNRKMDLSQAEAIADLISSDSSASHALAMNQMRGGFSKEIENLRTDLLNFASLIELELDFGEEDVEFANRDQMKALVNKVLEMVSSLASSFSRGNALKEGIPVAIAGKPNAGKSTLLNALLREDRAIVSDIPGTTRDTIEDEFILEGIKFKLIDTAGIRQTEDVIESMGVGRTMEKIRSSGIVLYVFDLSITTPEELKEELKDLDIPGRLILVGNKTDKATAEQIEKYKDQEDLILLSAKDGKGLQSLEEILAKPYLEGISSGSGVVVTNLRHYEALVKTRSALERVLEGLGSSIHTDLIAMDLRSALYHLGEITGKVSSDDILINIFSKFCIGK